MPDASCAILHGDPEDDGGLYVIRIVTKGRVVVPPHWHPEDEHITVLEGAFGLGLGDQFDESALRTMPAQSFAFVPKETRHFSVYEAGTMVQVHGFGPLHTFYVNPGDGLGDVIEP
jgi:quercetin dioxygenase-like cupin family protein